MWSYCQSERGALVVLIRCSRLSRRKVTAMLRNREMKRENRELNEVVLQARVIRSACEVGNFVKVFVNLL